MVARPKLLLLVTSSAWGGAERYVARLAQAACGEFDVTVAAGASPKKELFQVLPPNVRSVELPELVHAISPGRDLKAIVALRRLIDREGFDLVHANSSKAGLISAVAARFSETRPRVLFTAHGWGFLERRSLLFRSALLLSEKLASCWRDATIVLSEKERGIALRHRLAQMDALFTIPLAIDPEEIKFMDRDEARAKLETLCGTRLPHLVLGTIANAYPAKNLPALFEAFERLAEEFPELDLVILGDGPEMPRLQALHAALLHRDRVHLPGAVPNAAVLLKSFDAFVLSSTKEGLPWTILEASLARLPIVATRVGAIPELITDRQTGLLVPPGNTDALWHGLRELLSDHALYRKLKSGAPQIAERRSGTDMANAVLGIYRKLIGSPPSAPAEPRSSR